MPKLNEYIGGLVSSITNARVLSDLQTVKVAEEYAKHKLLKHFSVPRMRIDDVEMTIPIAMDELNQTAEKGIEPIDKSRFNALVYKEILNSIGLASLPAKHSQKIRSEISAKTIQLETRLRAENDIIYLKTYSEEVASLVKSVFADEALGALRGKVSINPEKIAAALENKLSGEIKLADPKRLLGNLNVIVESQKLREHRPENILYIKLKISEDGMEWNISENSKGQIEERLLPE
jgi:hypothetical protein